MYRPTRTLGLKRRQWHFIAWQNARRTRWTIKWKQVSQLLQRDRATLAQLRIANRWKLI